MYFITKPLKADDVYILYMWILSAFFVDGGYIMILSLGLILIIGFSVGFLLNKIKIPGLVGLILIGILFGPYALDIIDDKILSISSELRQIALIIILTRSGLNLDIKSLKKIGKPAFLMCFIPASFEIVGITIASKFLLNLNVFEGMLLGSVIAAVSPAVVSPRMIKLIDGGYKDAPKLILAGASVDDIYVIVLFYSFLGLVDTNTFSFSKIALIPLSIILGILLGLIFGILLILLFKHTSFSPIINTLILLSTSFIMIGIENILKEYISISSLLGIMVLGILILFKNKPKAQELSNCYNNLWQVFEILLFVLVGAALNFKSLGHNVPQALLVLLIGLLFRCIGVLISISFTNFNLKEKLFIIISYIPKATVQASIGGIALSMGLDCGNIILCVAILSILLTAPIGAILIDNLSPKLLTKQEIDI